MTTMANKEGNSTHRHVSISINCPTLRKIYYIIIIAILTFLLQIFWVTLRVNEIDDSMIKIKTKATAAHGPAANDAHRQRQQLSFSQGNATERLLLVMNSNEDNNNPIDTEYTEEIHAADYAEAKYSIEYRNEQAKTIIKLVSTQDERKREIQKGRRMHFNPRLGLHEKPKSFKDGIGLPIFVPSLPKSGTTSIWQYFNFSGRIASHQYVKVNKTYTELAGECIRHNIDAGRAPFDNCGSYDAYTDTGYTLYMPRSGNVTKRFAIIAKSDVDSRAIDCYYPSIQAMDAIYQYYPNSTIVMVHRDSWSWYRSTENWTNGSLLKRLSRCNIPGFPPANATAKDFVEFYEWHTDSIRQFARDHPSLTYIEVSLEGMDTGKILKNTIGIPSKCWGKCTPSSKFCEETSGTII